MNLRGAVFGGALALCLGSSSHANLDDKIKLLIPTYLGNNQRNYYGNGVPEKLDIISSFNLGTGKTRVGSKTKKWSGAGWTGQPAIISDNGQTYAIIGAYDHNLRKINLETNQEIWKYSFDDAVKGSPTVFIDKNATEENKIVVLQGSRGNTLDEPTAKDKVYSFRAVSFRTGKELWKIDARKTESYSRDNDASALDMGDGTIFNASENGIGSFINVNTKKVLNEVVMYSTADVTNHKRNVTTEGSPSKLEDRLYVASGAGHVYGIDVPSKKIDWSFYTGSDMDGSAVISKDKKLFCTVEKQYISGNGGVFKLNPSKKENEAVEWYLPVKDRHFAFWDGGIISSVALNDSYNDGSLPKLFATNTIEGKLYIGSQDKVTGEKTKGPNSNKNYDVPFIIAKENVGPSISTPIFTDGNKLVSATYDGIFMYKLDFVPTTADNPNALFNKQGIPYEVKVNLEKHIMPNKSFEATPVLWNGKVVICSRDGNMYVLGKDYENKYAKNQ